MKPFNCENVRVGIELEARVLDASWTIVQGLGGMDLHIAMKKMALTWPHRLQQAVGEGYIQISPEFSKDQFEIATYGQTTWTQAIDLLVNVGAQLAEVLRERYGATIDLSATAPDSWTLEYTDYKPYYPMLAHNAMHQAQKIDPKRYGHGGERALRLFDILSMQFNIDDPDLTLYKSQAIRVHDAVSTNDFSQLWTPARLEMFREIVGLVSQSGMIQPGIVPPLFRNLRNGEFLSTRELIEYYLQGEPTQHLIEIKQSSHPGNQEGHYTEIKFTDSGVVEPTMFQPNELAVVIENAAKRNLSLIQESYEEFVA